MILVLTRVNAAGPDYIEGVVSPAREFGATKVTAAGGSETRPLRAVMPGLWTSPNRSGRAPAS